MIHEIRVENFYSIREEMVVDLRIPGTSPELSKFRTSNSRDDIRLPTIVAFFGANASGKSTILRALTSTIRFVNSSFDAPIEGPITGFVPFMCDDCWDKPTKFSIEFDAGWFGEEQSLFRYHLELVGQNNEQLDLPNVGSGVGWDRVAVKTEALERSTGKHPQKGKRRTWQRVFERRIGKDPIIADWLNMKPSDKRLTAVRPNASIISTLARLNVDWAQDIWRDLSNMQSNLWGLNRAPTQVNENNSNLWGYYRDNPEILDLLNKQLASFDTGISGLEIISKDNKVFPLFHHRGLDAAILFEEESSGTQHIVSMFPQIYFVLSAGHIAVIDEFDSDLHPALVPEIFRWFYNTKTNPSGAQLFLTAHNSHLLTVLDKEEVVFVEKGSKGNTTVTRGLDFEGLRREPSLEEIYMSGALGALPRIG